MSESFDQDDDLMFFPPPSPARAYAYATPCHKKKPQIKGKASLSHKQKQLPDNFGSEKNISQSSINGDLKKNKSAEAHIEESGASKGRAVIMRRSKSVLPRRPPGNRDKKEAERPPRARGRSQSRRKNPPTDNGADSVNIRPRSTSRTREIKESSHLLKKTAATKNNEVQKTYRANSVPPTRPRSETPSTPTVPKSPTWLKRGKAMSARKPKLNPEQDCSEGRELKKAEENKRDFRKLRAKYAEYKKRAASGKANVS